MSQESIPEQAATGPKFCPSCGTPLDGNPKFCPDCGTRLSRPAPQMSTDSEDQSVAAYTTQDSTTTGTESTAIPDQPSATGSEQVPDAASAVDAAPIETTPPPKGGGALKWVIVAVAVVIGIVIVAGASGAVEENAQNNVDMVNELNESAAQQAAASVDPSDYREIPYADLERNPDRYEGEKVTYRGEVVQVQEYDDGNVNVRLAVNGDHDQIILVGYYSSILDSRVLEEDGLAVYGEFDGLYTYEAVMGNSVTVPSMWADKVELLGLGG